LPVARWPGELEAAASADCEDMKGEEEKSAVKKATAKKGGKK
jgi:hypothetical protein